MFTLESAELFRVTRLSEYGVSHIADNVVLLQHLRDGAQMKRALTVLKTRGSSHATTVREFRISQTASRSGTPLTFLPSRSSEVNATESVTSTASRPADT